MYGNLFNYWLAQRHMYIKGKNPLRCCASTPKPASLLSTSVSWYPTRARYRKLGVHYWTAIAFALYYFITGWILFEFTQKIIIVFFPAGGSVYLEAFAFSTFILFVLSKQIKLFPFLQAALRVWKHLPCFLPPFSLFWLNQSNYSLPCRRFCVSGSLCLVLYLHSLCFDSTNKNYSLPCRRFYVSGSLCLVLYLHSLCFDSTNKNYSLPCRRFCVSGSLCLVLYLHSLCFDSTNQIVPFRGSACLEAFALFSTSILFVLTQQIKLFPSVVLSIWKPLPCSLPPFSLFWLNKSNYFLPCRRLCVFGSLCLVLYLHSLYFD